MKAEMGRNRLWRWLGRFSLANGLLLLLIGIRFLAHYSWPEGSLSFIYLVTASLGHYALLAGLPLILLGGTVILFLPRRGLLTFIASVVAAALLAWLFLDSLVFTENRFHITSLTARILAAKTWLFGAVYFFIAIILEFQLAGYLWRRLESGKARSGGAWLGSLVIVSLFFAQLTHIWADANYYTPVTGLTEYLPGYRGATAKAFLLKRGWANLEQARERALASRLARGDTDQRINYPMVPIKCTSPEKPLNLLVILIDALRWDMLKPETTPNLSRFASTSATRFEHHYSGGNSSRMGVFSLFYGLPVTYWKALESIQRSAVLVDELAAARYNFGIFSSAPLYRPVTLDRTAFANVPGLRLATEPLSDAAHIRDRKITREWVDWLNAHDGATPFFGFLFYDAPAARDSPAGYAGQIEPKSSQEHHVELARYQTAIHYDDSLIGEVLDHLQNRDLLDSTVIVVTSDHGEQFAPGNRGLQGHGSAYTQDQLQVPFLLHWPGRPSGRVDARTSHNDVAPTLLSDLLGCDNDPADYSSGRNLFAGEDWEWLVAGSYYNYAIIQPDSIIITYPNGMFEVRDMNYDLVENPKLDEAVLTAVMQENTRFYK